MQYKIVFEKTAEKLTIDINYWIKSGWTPQGGVSTNSKSGRHQFFQAIIKTKK